MPTTRVYKRRNRHEEEDEAMLLSNWLSIRGYKFTHIPNETGGSREAIIRAQKMKRQGTSAGFPDYIIYLKNGLTLHLELKKKKGGSLSPNQRKWRDFLQAFGAEWYKANGRDDAVDHIQSIDKGLPCDAYTSEENDDLF